MRLLRRVLLLAISLLIWCPEILTADVPLIARRYMNKTTNWNETYTRQKAKPSGTGLGSDPVNTGHGEHHDIHFFEATPKNIKASKFGAAYVDWIRKVDKTSAAWRDRQSEPDYFAKTVLEWPDDVNCGVAYNGCGGRPLSRKKSS